MTHLPPNNFVEETVLMWQAFQVGFNLALNAADTFTAGYHDARQQAAEFDGRQYNRPPSPTNNIGAPAGTTQAAGGSPQGYPSLRHTVMTYLRNHH
jgi:hypothetical protein